jgi:predicted HicB family RNase H-like nuclease
MAKRMGRPPKKASEKLTASFPLKMTQDEKAAHIAKAQAAGISLTTWIRRTLNRAKK